MRPASEAYDKSAEDEGAFQSVEIPIQKGVARYVFNSIPYGDYAAKPYHDKNGNKKLDTNFIGIPKEPYGFSNNARGTLSAPEYIKAKFTLDAANKADEFDSTVAFYRDVMGLPVRRMTEEGSSCSSSAARTYG